jgi:DeoR/GlpR family transcriptional regulator of sugar metabolism
LQGVALKAQNGPLGGSTANRLADLYNVSRNTIRRDSRIANAINKIGEVSPEIKMDILSGEINITRRQLKEIESGTEKDLDIIVEQMLDGTFEKPKREMSKAVKKNITSVNFPVALQSFNAINDITNTFYTKLQKLSNNEDAKGSKSALRLYIDTLEKLYKQI